MNDREKQLANLVNTDDHRAVCEEIRAIVTLIFPRFDFAVFARAWDDIILPTFTRRATAANPFIASAAAG